MCGLCTGSWCITCPAPSSQARGFSTSGRFFISFIIHARGMSLSRCPSLPGTHPPPTSPWFPGNQTSLMSCPLLSSKSAGLNFALRSSMETACRTWRAGGTEMLSKLRRIPGISKLPTEFTESKSPKKRMVTSCRQKVLRNFFMNSSALLSVSVPRCSYFEYVSHAKFIISSLPLDRRPIV